MSTSFPEAGGTAISILGQLGVSKEIDRRAPIRGQEQTGAGTLTVS